MDQKKTGGFIAAKRKEKSLTQQQLADTLGISNKTVSKWECGNGMPEVSLMLPLCGALDISVNELLSGQELDEAYVERAEENFVTLIREKEQAKGRGRKGLLWQVASLPLAMAIWLVLFADSSVHQLGQRPTPLTLCYLIVAFAAIYAVVSVCGWGVLKREPALLLAALSFASLACLVICLAYQTFWLMLPAAAGLVLCLALSVRSLCKGRAGPKSEDEAGNEC